MRLKNFTLLDCPLPWQEAGLSYTASGYGSRIPTRYKVRFDDGRVRRVYATAYGNAASVWVVLDGEKVFLPDTF